MHILIIGPYPPPLGGNSVHIQRLMLLLQAANHCVKVLDILSENPATSQPEEVLSLSGSAIRKLVGLLSVSWSTPRDTIIHIHVSAMGRFKQIAPLLLILFWRQPKVITIHSGSFIQQVSTSWLQFYIKQILCCFNGIIVVNDEQAEYLKTLRIPPEKINVIPAFLPPAPDTSSVPDQIAAVVGKKILVVTSGYLTPLYNYDLLIDCIERLDQDAYHFVFAFYNTVDSPYEAHISERLALFPNVTVMRDQSPGVFAGVLSQSDIYVRATHSDGDAVAIREALYFNKTVFASDCVKRPDACKLFISGDSSDLMRLFLSDHPVVFQASEPYFQRILNVYHKVQNTISDNRRR